MANADGHKRQFFVSSREMDIEQSSYCRCPVSCVFVKGLISYSQDSIIQLYMCGACDTRYLNTSFVLHASVESELSVLRDPVEWNCRSVRGNVAEATYMCVRAMVTDHPAGLGPDARVCLLVIRKDI